MNTNDYDNLFFIARPCVVCKEPFQENEILVCLGKPYHCAVHHRCYYQFPLSGGWPHPFPLERYKDYTVYIGQNLKEGKFLSNSGNKIKHE